MNYDSHRRLNVILSTSIKNEEVQSPGASNWDFRLLEVVI